MRTKIPRCALALLGLALVGTAQAQWKWLDSAGQVNYSDHPPPVSVPATRILSQGGTMRAAQAVQAAGAAGTAGGGGSAGGVARDAAATPDVRANATSGSAGAPAQQAASGAPAGAPASAAPGAGSSAAPAKPRTAAERLNDLRKQQALKETAEREAAQLQRAQAGVAKWCEELQGRARTLESGMRMARVEADGEQAVLSDEERASQLQGIRRDLAAQCASGT
ncbi:DUF4124 domain-containing protein [Quisquiliibacterium transsilvanicum]|uniref:DUF4124 domain-containing protein n=1 Tax=Quisquiliibacterium transsilvanicum TaxID=1549638 RepID=A0A7W8M808_9BURK|nr:DUF4124 domain-containing protein [Quisquiliibacterium transsilvanicum]MBB5270494.1 hypothetical protein [Quisquiliibacterium transsilvanicum]